MVSVRPPLTNTQPKVQNKNRVNVYLRFTRFFSKLLIKSNYFDFVVCVRANTDHCPQFELAATVKVGARSVPGM